MGAPKRYLGASISKYQLGKKEFWSMSAEQYIKNALIAIKEKYILDSKRVTTPMSSGYRPEVDTSELLNDDDANYYQSLIGILQWTVELGRIDIAVEVGMLSTFMCSPREGHLQQALHIFAYLEKHMRSKLVFDSDIIDFSDYNWIEATGPNFIRMRKSLSPTICLKHWVITWKLAVL